MNKNKNVVLTHVDDVKIGDFIYDYHTQQSYMVIGRFEKHYKRTMPKPRYFSDIPETIIHFELSVPGNIKTVGYHAHNPVPLEKK